MPDSPAFTLVAHHSSCPEVIPRALRILRFDKLDLRNAAPRSYVNISSEAKVGFVVRER